VNLIYILGNMAPLCIFHELNSFAKSMGLKLKGIKKGAWPEAPCPAWREFRDIGVSMVCVSFDYMYHIDSRW
jgi:hypothetical protein